MADHSANSVVESKTTVGRNVQRQAKFLIPIELEVRRSITRANTGITGPDEVVGRSEGWISFDGYTAAVVDAPPAEVGNAAKTVIDRTLFSLWVRQRIQLFRVGLWGLKNLFHTGKLGL